VVVSLDPHFFFQLCRFTYDHATSGQGPELAASQRSLTTFGPPSGLRFPTAGYCITIPVGSGNTINDKNWLLGEITKIIKIIIANGLPITEGKSEVWINPLITGG
jgi:hypothetical protein